MTAGAALLIGNTRYRRESVFRSLATPKNDVENLSDRLRELGFVTSVIHDADRAAMGEAIGQFRSVIAKLAERAPVYFHFAGHGIQRSGENYLVPVDAAGDSETEVLFSCVRLSDVMDMLCWREDQQKLIVLDACRSNHVPSSTRSGVAGLAGESPDRYERVHETYLLYATSAGRIAIDGVEYGASPLCRGLLDAFKNPSVPIAMLAAHVTAAVYRSTGRMQKPWGTGNLCHLWPFALNDGGGTLVQSPGEPVPGFGVGYSIDPRDRRISESGHLIHKLKARDSSGNWAYYFVLVETEKESQFLSAFKKNGTIDLDDFGTVIASNYGEEPSEEVRSYLKEHYGFDV